MSNKPGVIFLQDGTQLAVPCEAKHVGDGFHTFDDLYKHRCLLFIALMKSHPSMSWRSRLHADGSSHAGWCIVGMRAPHGDVTYHIPDSMWHMLDGIETNKKAPEWDGHTSHDVIDRLTDWISDGVW